MRILAVTYAFAPLQFPATFRLLKWFKGLNELGHQVEVLAVHPESFEGPKDQGLLDLVPPNVTVHQVPSPENGLLYRLLRRRQQLFYRAFEPRKREWLRPAFQAAKRLPLEEYDLILTCSQPPVCHLVGLRLARSIRKPWVAYFSDPWSDNPFKQGQSRAIHQYNLSLEREVVRRADRLVFSSPETVRLVLAKYDESTAQKATVLSHCFVREWYDSKSLKPPWDGSDKTVLLHMGNLYGIRSPMPLIHALRRIQGEGFPMERLELWFFGRLEPHYRDALLSESTSIHIHDSVPYLSALSLMRAADALLLIDAPVDGANESVFLPSKLVDYLGSGRPVIGITPPRGASARVIEKCGGTVCDIEDIGQVAAALRNLGRDKPVSALNANATADYEYTLVTRRFEELLRSAL